MRGSHRRISLDGAIPIALRDYPSPLTISRNFYRMTLLGFVLMFMILLSAAHALRKSRRNLAGWAIVLGLVYYHPLFLSWTHYESARIGYSLLYLPIAIMALRARAVSFEPPNPAAIRIYPTLFLLIFIVSIIGVQFQVGLQNLRSAKLLSGQAIDNFSNFSLLMYASGALYAVAKLTQDQKKGAIIAGVLILYFVAFGDRTQPAFIALYGLILYSVLGRIRYLALLPPFLIFLLLYGKQVYIFFLTQDATALHQFSAVTSEGLAEPVALMQATETGMGLSVDLPPYLHTFLLYLTPFSVGDNLHLFQDVYKQILFPTFSDSAGAAGNIILEIYWNYGYWGLPVFGGILCVAISLTARASRHSSIFSMVGLLLFVILFMYMPRNSLFTLISHEKKFAYTFAVAWALRYFHLKIVRKS
jgi:hypothetical protein